MMMITKAITIPTMNEKRLLFFSSSVVGVLSLIRLCYWPTLSESASNSSLYIGHDL